MADGIRRDKRQFPEPSYNAQVSSPSPQHCRRNRRRPASASSLSSSQQTSSQAPLSQSRSSTTSSSTTPSLAELAAEGEAQWFAMALVAHLQGLLSLRRGGEESSPVPVMAMSSPSNMTPASRSLTPATPSSHASTASLRASRSTSFFLLTSGRAPVA